MWGHYADKHRGCVIGFDSTHEFFRQPSLLRDVTYVKDRVVFDTSWHAGTPEQRNFGTQVVLSKNDDWTYEQEVRQILPLHPLTRRPVGNGQVGFFRPIPVEIVRTITLGLKCSSELAPQH